MIRQWMERPSFYPLMLFVLVGVVWGHSIHFGFVWDDHFFVTHLESIRSLEKLPAMFTRLDAQSSHPEMFLLFRPLRTVVYSLLYHLSAGTLSPTLFHLNNLLWHAAAVLLFYLTGLRLLERLRAPFPHSGRRGAAFLMAAAFAVHPVNSEVVCWVKSLDDCMAAVFLLGSMHLLLGLENPSFRMRRYWAAVFVFLLAVYSKISAVPFPAMLLFLFVAVHRISWSASFVRCIPFGLAALVFMGHRHWVIGRSSQTEPLSGTYFQTLLDMFPVIPKYGRLILGIPPFHIDYSFMKGGNSFSDPMVLLGLSIFLVWGVASIAFWRQEKTRMISLGALWIGIFLLPVSNLLPMMQYMADRFLYLPLFGALLMLAGLALWRPGKVWLGIGAAAVVLWSAVAMDRSMIWKDELTLFLQTHFQGPSTERLRNNAVVAIFNQPELSRIFEVDRKTGQLTRILPPESAEEHDQAVASLKSAQEIFPSDHRLYAGLGILHALNENFSEAIPLFREAIRIKPEDARMHSNLAKALMESGNLVEAGKSIEKALELNSQSLNVLNVAEAVYQAMGKRKERLEVLEKLQRLLPDDPLVAEKIKEATAPLD